MLEGRRAWVLFCNKITRYWVVGGEKNKCHEGKAELVNAHSIAETKLKGMAPKTEIKCQATCKQQQKLYYCDLDFLLESRRRREV